MMDIQEDKSKKGIWQYWQYFPKIEEKYWLSLGEGGTPAITVEEIIFKREDLNPTGSLKDRGMAYQISQAYSEGVKDLVISSSGNAAISAGAYCQKAGINLHVFVSENISAEKLEKIKSYGGKVEISSRPVSDSIKFTKEQKVYPPRRSRGRCLAPHRLVQGLATVRGVNCFKDLRPSVDPFGAEGYKTIAFEIFKEFGKIDDIFLPVSSATCLVGTAEGFKTLGFLPRFHACQSTKVNLIAGEFDKDFIRTKDSLATALVAKISARKEEALKIINKSKGWGWVIGDEACPQRQSRSAGRGGRGIKEAGKWLEERGIETSAEGALALSGIWKAKKEGWQLGKTVCLLTGRKYV